MRIHDVCVENMRRELEQPIADAQIVIPERISVLVRVRADDGIEGVGEAAGFGGTHATVKTIVEQQLAPLLIGENPLLVARLWGLMYRGTAPMGRRGAVVAAMSGVDIALWDLMGKVAGLPVHQLLGGARSQIRGYASGRFYAKGKGEAELTREFGDYATRGFGAAKMNVGGLPIRDDVSRVRVGRKALGPGIQLMIDANNQYTAKQALGMAAKVEEFDIACFEEPVPADDL